MTEIGKKTGTFSSFDGTNIYYEVRGDGEPVIFVYGIACLINHWHHQINYFSKSYQTIAFDLRGHHKSSIPIDEKNKTIACTSKDIVHLMDHLKIKKAHFAGHSFGVPVLLDFAANYPDRVKSIALVNGFASNPMNDAFGLGVVDKLYGFIQSQYSNNKLLFDLLWSSAINNPISMWLSGLAGGFNLKLTQFKDIEIYARGVSQISLEIFIPLFGDMMRFDGRRMCQQINSPVLVVGGDHDLVTPLKFQEELHSELKNSEYVVVPYGSHCSQLDFPDYLNLKLEKFFESHK